MMIAHWEGNHYIVVYQVEAKRVLIADPAIGRKWIPRQEFLSKWTGYALLLDPTNRFNDLDVKKQTSLWRYISALSPHRSIIIQIIVVSLVIQIFGMVSPLLTQIILDKVVVQRSLETLNVVAIGLVLFSVWGLCMSSVRQYLLSYFSNRIDLTLISGFIHHAISLPMQFFESRRVGDILTRVQENQKIQRFLIGQVVLSWLNFITGFVYLGLMLYYNWKLTLLVLGLIPPIVILTLSATPLLRKVSREIFKEVADQNSSLVEMMTGIGTVKTVAVERELRWRWEDHLTRQLNARFKGQKLGIGLGAANGLINAIGSAVLLWYGASLVIKGELTIGQLVAFNMMTGYVISPVIALANLWDELQEILISVERLNDVFETQVEEPSNQQLLLMPSIHGDIEFENVTFKYNKGDEHNILQNLTFSVKAGQTIAIVGRSGSGKTTLVKVLEKLYQPDQGRIVIDGHDIAHVSPQSLRSQLGVVPQECFLFSGTIFENITLYRPDFSLEDVVAAAKLAEAHVFIQSMPLGYSTVVGERGSTLSGGQRQRIAIARALLGNPRVLILDEATSSLDTESEQRFQENLAQVSRDRTTFIIAHRLSTVRDADQILVLDRGVLVERGSHDELLEAKGIYYHLAHQQLNL
jgi:ATP-binding cassette subfamily B protein